MLHARSQDKLGKFSSHIISFLNDIMYVLENLPECLPANKLFISIYLW